MQKPKKIKSYEIKKQPFGGFKIVEYSSYENSSTVKKRTLYKELDLTEAENIVYQIESKKQ